jgi:hypothetical protein
MLESLIGAVTAIINYVKKRDVQGHAKASEYFAKLASTLTEIHEKLEANEIPYQAGNRFKSLLNIAAEKTEGVNRLGTEELQRYFDDLRRAAKDATNIDYHSPPPKERVAMLKNMKRLAGKLESLALELKPAK